MIDASPATAKTDAAAAPPAPRRMGRVNARGFWTLYAKEVRRFTKVMQQTLIAPIVTTLLFLAIFVLALGDAGKSIGGVPFEQFLAPGLVMMAIAQNAFANTSTSIVGSKMQGSIVDMLMPPLSAAELAAGFALACATRGILVGAACAAAMSLFVALPLAHPLLALYHAAMAALMLSLLGTLAGVWADKFDHVGAVTNFVVTPLAFLSGTFYSIDRLPGFWNHLAHANPLFFAIDGFRAGFIGRADANLWLGAAVVALVNLGLALACYRMFKTGYKLRP